MKAIGYISTTILLLIYASIINGWALTKLWAWFIVTTFGLPALSIPAGIGFAIVVEYLTHRASQNKDDREFSEVLIHGAVYSTVRPLMALLIGVIVKIWM